MIPARLSTNLKAELERQAALGGDLGARAQALLSKAAAASPQDDSVTALVKRIAALIDQAIDAQQVDPDNLTDPNDRLVWAHLQDARAILAAAVADQATDVTEDLPHTAGLEKLLHEAHKRSARAELFKYSDTQPRDATGRRFEGGGSGASNPLFGGAHNDWVAGGMKGDSPARSTIKTLRDSYSAMAPGHVSTSTTRKNTQDALNTAATEARLGDQAARAGTHAAAAGHYAAAATGVANANAQGPSLAQITDSGMLS